MRIGDSSWHRVPPTGPAGPAEKPAEEFRAEDGADRVYLSRLSQALLLCGLPPARLEHLRSLVQSDAYEIPAAELSRRIVQFYLDISAEDTGGAG